MPHSVEKIELVNFKNMSKYRSSNKKTDIDGKSEWEHKDCMDVDTIAQSLHNASIEVMNFKSPSRRDDLKMLCYMLCSLMRKNCFDQYDHDMSIYLMERHKYKSDEAVYRSILQRK